MSTYTFSVDLPCEPPSSNSRMPWAMRAHRTKVIRDKVALVGKSERNRLKVPPADGHRWLRLTLVKPVASRGGWHPMDSDNLQSALKGCRDALCPPRVYRNSVHPGSSWITGDKPSDVTVVYAQEPGARLAVRVEVTSRDEGVKL